MCICLAAIRKLHTAAPTRSQKNVDTKTAASRPLTKVGTAVLTAKLSVPSDELELEVSDVPLPVLVVPTQAPREELRAYHACHQNQRKVLHSGPATMTEQVKARKRSKVTPHHQCCDHL